MPTDSQFALFEQTDVTKIPTLHAGEITASTMYEFENGCLSYFAAKEVEDDKQVAKILPAFRDGTIRNWINVHRARLKDLSFDEFMKELRDMYLQDDWENIERRKLMALSMGTGPFYAYCMKVQAANIVLSGTKSYFTDDKLRQVLENGMSEKLATKCSLERVDQEESLQLWIRKVKRIDEGMILDRKEFEEIARNGRDQHRRNQPFTEPSRRSNVASSSSVPAAAASSSRTRCPRITDGERRLLLDNDGCLKCRKFFAGHRGTACPFGFPDPATYKTLTQADVDAARRRLRSRPVAAVTAHEAETSTSSANIHPVAVVMGSSSFPGAAQFPPNATNVLENSFSVSESSDGSS